MKAGLLKKKYVKLSRLNETSVVAISQDPDDMFWGHVHDNEELPEKGFDIAIFLGRNKK